MKTSHLLLTTLSLSLLLTACGPGVQVNEDFGQSFTSLSTSQLLGSSQKTLDDVETIVETGEEANVEEATGAGPFQKCGIDIQRPSVDLPTDAKEREVLHLLTRQQAIERLIALAEEMKERTESEKGPNLERLSEALQKIEDEIAKLEADESYQDAFEKGKERLAQLEAELKERRMNLPVLTDEQRTCLKEEARKNLCQHIERVMSDHEAGTSNAPINVVEHFQAFQEKNCQTE